jgi:hypothetical protein
VVGFCTVALTSCPAGLQLHAKVPEPPDAEPVSDVDVPKGIDWSTPAFTVGNVFTVTVEVVVAVHAAAFVTVTVYVVVVAGVTVIAAVFPPALHA